jgi:hypothetical protein
MALVKYNNNSISNVTTTALAEGSLVPIKTLTASSSSTVNFAHGSNGVVFDNTYPIYKFEIINIHPSDNAQFMIHFSTDGGSNFNTNMQTAAFQVYHKEDDTSTQLNYRAGDDLTNGTNGDGVTSTYAPISQTIGNDNKMCGVSTIYVFNPSSTTFAKHFMATTQVYMDRDSPQLASVTQYYVGYINTTSSVDAVSFKMFEGTIDSGTFKLYGIKDS